jgi:protease I
MKAWHNFVLDASFDDVRAEDHDAVVIPGDRAPAYIRRLLTRQPPLGLISP